jgi:hypothetical protein
MDALIATVVFGGTLWLLCALLLRWSEPTSDRHPAVDRSDGRPDRIHLQVVDGGLLTDAQAPEGIDGELSRSSDGRIPAGRWPSAPPATRSAPRGTRPGASSARSA